MNEGAILAELGELICEARQSATLEQSELAGRIDKSASYLSRIENGLAMPSIGVVQALAHELSMDPRPLQRLLLAAQVTRLAGSDLSLQQIKNALVYLGSEDSPLDRALSWTAGLSQGSDRPTTPRPPDTPED